MLHVMDSLVTYCTVIVTSSYPHQQRIHPSQILVASSTFLGCSRHVTQKGRGMRTGWGVRDSAVHPSILMVMCNLLMYLSLGFAVSEPNLVG